jgi:hypothetical protein
LVMLGEQLSSTQHTYLLNFKMPIQQLQKHIQRSQ